eukprot:Nitzschia sp. Nitz4//scaffold57_size113557//2031//5846//NITZ4_003978-RA/size113557-augustus-gene-0.177-mRNA-1//-1//CDS//3329554807//1758//frame0
MDNEHNLSSDIEGRTADIEMDTPCPSSNQSVQKPENAESPSVRTSSLSVWSKRDKGWEAPRLAIEDSKDASTDNDEDSLDSAEVHLEDPEDPVLFTSISSFQSSGRGCQVVEESILMASFEDLIQPPNREPSLEMPTEPVLQETDRSSSAGSVEIAPARRSRSSKTRRSVALLAALRSSSRLESDGSSGSAEPTVLPSSLTGINTTPESPMTPSSGRRTSQLPVGLARLISKTNVLEPEALDTQSHMSERTNASQHPSVSKRNTSAEGNEEPKTPPGTRRGYVHGKSSESSHPDKNDQGDKQDDLEIILKNSTLKPTKPTTLEERLNSSRQSLNDSLNTFETFGQSESMQRSPYRTPSRAERRILRLQERAERLNDSSSGGLDAVETSPVPPGIKLSASVYVTPKGKREIRSPASTPGAVSMIQPMTVGGNLMAPDLSDSPKSPKSPPTVTESISQSDKVPRSASDTNAETKRREQRARELALIDEVRSSSTILPMIHSNLGTRGLGMSLPTIPSVDSNDFTHANPHVAMLHSRPLEPHHPEDDAINVDPIEERIQDAQVTLAEASPLSDIKLPTRPRWHIYAAALSFVIVVAVAVAVVCAVSLGGGGGSDDAAKSRALTLLESVSDSEKLNTNGSPQALAFAWVVSDSIAVLNDDDLVNRYLLAVFYFALKGSSWVSANGWLSSGVEVCEWEFVMCSDNTQGVLSIHAEANHLIGQIPSEIFKLQELASIHLPGNVITGLVPGVVDSELVDLDLSNNVLEGTIPGALTVLSNLVKLNLEDNDLSGEVPSDFKRLTNIRELSLAGSLIEGSACDWIHTLPKIELLDISATELSGDLDCLTGLKNLVSLKVDFLRGFEGTISPSVGSLQSLKSLSAVSTDLSGSIPTNVAVLTSLGTYNTICVLFSFLHPVLILLLPLSKEYLGLANTKVSGTFPKDSLGSLSSLDTLYLANTRLSGTIPTEIGLITNLVTLDLNGCSFITGSVPSEIGSLNSLTKLHLGSTSLSGSIPDFVGELSSLESLSLRYSGLDGTVPHNICTLPNITTVCTQGLADNSCSCGEDICSC